GRPRRTGWLDLPALRYAVGVNGLDGLALTKLDVMTGLEEIKVCVAYETASGRTNDLPLDDLERATPIYRSFKGWSEELGEARSMEELPPAAREYLAFIEEQAECPLVLASIGPRRD